MPITDDFDGGTNGNLLDTSADWEHLYDGGSGGTSDRVDYVTDGGGLNITLDQYGYDGGHQTGTWARTESGGFDDDQYAEGERDDAGGSNLGMGVAIRLDSNGDGYYCAHGGGVLRTYRLDAGTRTQLQQNFPTTAVGDVVRIEAVGSTITTDIDATEEHSNTDTTHTSGVPGFATNGTSTGSDSEWDDFECTDASGGAAAGGIVRPPLPAVQKHLLTR